MNENEVVQNNEEEISLIDLFAVLIKHRVLIVLVTVIVTVLAGLYLFVAPKVIKSLDKTSVTVSYNVKAASLPKSMMEKFPESRNTPIYLASYNANRIQFLVEEFKQFRVFNEDEMSEYEFNGFVQQLITKKKYSIRRSELGSEFEIIFDIPLDKIDVATDLVKDIISKTEVELKAYFNPLIEELEENTSNSIEKALQISSSTTDMSSLQNLQNLSVEIEKFKTSTKNYLELNEAPFVIPQARGRAKKLVIVCFAAFFIAVFMAFLLNAIENIKKDPEASKVISDAWNAGKKSKK